MLETNHLIIDLERSITSGQVHYWKSNNRGYTTTFNEAGKYSAEKAEAIVKDDFDKRTVSVSLSTVHKIFRDSGIPITE